MSCGTAIGDKPDIPANAIESGTNYLNIGNLTLSDVVRDASDEDSDL